MASVTTANYFFSWSAIVRYATISAINLAILLTGLVLGVMVAPHLERPASANSGQQQSTPQSAVPSATPPAAQEQQYEELAPGLTTGSMAVGTFLAHRIAADQIMVNGYDVMALNEGLLNLLKNKNLVTYRELDAIVERAKVPRPLRMKSPTPPPTNPPAKPEDKK